jgi:hypothetical protein
MKPRGKRERSARHDAGKLGQGKHRTLHLPIPSSDTDRFMPIYRPWTGQLALVFLLALNVQSSICGY